MKKAFISMLAGAFCASLSSAAELSPADAGTYVILDKTQKPTDMFYRLSRSGEKWVAEGKQPGGPWTNISCDAGCEYRPATDIEIERHFPPKWRSGFEFACIQNVAQAFCRYVSKENPGRSGHVIVALVTGQPVPVFVRRVPP